MARPDEALPFLTRAEAALPRPESKYYAALFTGLAEVARGHQAEARSSLERAAARFPEAQSPRLAMAQALMMRAKDDEALASIQTLTVKTSVADPWWIYDIDLISSVGNRLASVRASISERLR
jgi:predicted Zn-dependent protease